MLCILHTMWLQGTIEPLARHREHGGSDMAEARKVKRITLALDADLAPWVDYMAGLEGGSVTAYINGVVRRDMAYASGPTKEGYEAFVVAREARREARG